MSPSYFLYNILISLAAPLMLAVSGARKRLSGRWSELLGFAPRLSGGAGGRVWVHAVSYGEVQVASGLIKTLKKRSPDLTVWLTTGTRAGRVAAQELIDPEIPILTYPLDAYGSPGRALRRLRPDMLILVETELWPNMLKAARKLRVKTMLANGRLSASSVAGYRRVGGFFREVLSCLDLLAMTRQEYRDTIISLGADPSRVVVVDTVKFDRLLERVDTSQVDKYRRELNLPPDQPVLAAGSTRGHEEAVILDVFQRLLKDFPDLHLVLAPRHVNRSSEIETMLRDRGLSFRKRSAGTVSTENVQVTLVDVMGELFYLYGLGHVTFVGGSLARLGGQNPLEPAAWAKPVLYGPSMENFLEARTLLEDAGAGRTVQNAEELYNEIKALLADPEMARSRGLAGFKALQARPGSTEQLVDLALNLLQTAGKA